MANKIALTSFGRTGCQFNWLKNRLKKLLEKPLEKPLEISYTGKTPKMGSLDMSQNQI